MPVPDQIQKALSEAAPSKTNVLFNQYTHSFGYPSLINAISKVVGRDIKPTSEVLVMAGAHEALLVSITGLVDLGDEVIIIELILTAMFRRSSWVPLHPPHCNKRLLDPQVQFSTNLGCSVQGTNGSVESTQATELRQAVTNLHMSTVNQRKQMFIRRFLMLESVKMTDGAIIMSRRINS